MIVGLDEVGASTDGGLLATGVPSDVLIVRLFDRGDGPGNDAFSRAHRLSGLPLAAMGQLGCPPFPPYRGVALVTHVS